MSFTDFETHQNTENFDDNPLKAGDDDYTFTLEELENFDPDDNFYTDPINKLLFGRLKKIDKEREKEERMYRTRKKYASFAEGIKAFSDAFNYSRYGTKSESPSFSEKAQERYEKIKAMRDKEEGRIFNFYSRYNKASGKPVASSNGMRSYGGRLFGKNYDNRQDYARAVYRYASEHGIPTFDADTPIGGTSRERIVPFDELAYRVQSYWETFDRKPIDY